MWRDLYTPFAVDVGAAAAASTHSYSFLQTALTFAVLQNFHCDVYNVRWTILFEYQLDRLPRANANVLLLNCYCRLMPFSFVSCFVCNGGSA